MCRRRALNEAQADALRRQYRLYLQNTPQKLAARYGIALGTVHQYAFSKHKRLPIKGAE